MNLYNWTEIPEEQLNPMISRQMIHTETMTVARLRLRKGALVPLHNHINEQISMVERGKLRFVIAGEERIVTGGQIVAIPANAPHLVEALEESLATDLFSPIREDWIRGDDAYLRAPVNLP
ncbi:MAG: cupin domain-containing protein [Acidobacteria bacterium]|nr:MAG: cupin domain-containing protein [Acidobacteriota bacterium]